MLALGSNARGRSGLLSILRPQDVFKTSLYTGNGGTQTIIDGFDPDLVWGKARAGQYAGDSSFGRHVLVDRVRGAGRDLATNLTDAEQTASNAVSFTASGGHVVGGATNINEPNTTFVNWAFRRATKFFDVVTYTGDGTSGRQISHDLGVAPGMIVIKRRDSAANWSTYHRSLGAANDVYLNLTNAAVAGSAQYPSAPTASTFTLGPSPNVNASGATYVAYLFAHDPSPDGIIQCGSGNAVLPWPPQWVLYKDAGATGDWLIADAARGFSPAGSYPTLRPNTSGAEAASGSLAISGNTLTFSGMTNPIWVAIRAPI